MSCDDCKRVVRRELSGGEVLMYCTLDGWCVRPLRECSEYVAKQIVVEMPISFSGLPEVGVKEEEVGKKRGRPWKK